MIDSLPQRSLSSPSVAFSAERFWAGMSRPDEGCWLWQRSCQPSGYGQTSSPTRRVALAHRVAYELAVGPIPPGLELDHLCRNRRCCRPDHLDVVTKAENMRRSGWKAGWATEMERRRTKTHCKHGHEYTPENTYRDARGHRACRACHREWSRRYKAAQP